MMNTHARARLCMQKAHVVNVGESRRDLVVWQRESRVATRTHVNVSLRVVRSARSATRFVAAVARIEVCRRSCLVRESSCRMTSSSTRNERVVGDRSLSMRVMIE
jgi:hypothetical protein